MKFISLIFMEEINKRWKLGRWRERRRMERLLLTVTFHTILYTGTISEIKPWWWTYKCKVTRWSSKINLLAPESSGTWSHLSTYFCMLTFSASTFLSAVATSASISVSFLPPWLDSDENGAKWGERPFLLNQVNLTLEKAS